MKCPNCNETLLMTERHSVEIDYCPNCRGVWLDKGELDKLLQFASAKRPDASGSVDRIHIVRTIMRIMRTSIKIKPIRGNHIRKNLSYRIFLILINYI